jgi:hypothetical protein
LDAMIEIGNDHRWSIPILMAFPLLMKMLLNGDKMLS